MILALFGLKGGKISSPVGRRTVIQVLFKDKGTGGKSSKK